MDLLISHNKCGLYVLTKRAEKRRFAVLMDEYHPQGYLSRAPMARKRMDIVYRCGDDWCVLMIVHLINNPYIAQKLRLDWNKTWFIRRIVTIPQSKNKYGDTASTALKLLCEWLKYHGAEAVLALTLPRHSGAVYKHAGFEYVMDAQTKGMKWFLRRLRE